MSATGTLKETTEQQIDIVNLLTLPEFTSLLRNAKRLIPYLPSLFGQDGWILAFFMVHH